MGDWVTKFFAIFTMYKSQKEAEELESAEDDFIEQVCLQCGTTFKVDALSVGPHFCPSCGKRIDV